MFIEYQYLVLRVLNENECGSRHAGGGGGGGFGGVPPKKCLKKKVWADERESNQENTMYACMREAAAFHTISKVRWRICPLVLCEENTGHSCIQRLRPLHNIKMHNQLLIVGGGITPLPHPPPPPPLARAR